MSDTSKSKTKGVNLNLGKTFESGLSLGFDSFIGETKETGDYNLQPKKTKKINLGSNLTTPGGTTLGVNYSRSKAKENKYYPKRKEESLIFSISKQFNTGGDVQIHRKGNVDKDLL